MPSRFRRVWVVFRKELLDTLRDRRTLLAMIVVPIVLYPILMLVMVQALRMEAGRRQVEQYTVAVPDEAHRAWLLEVLRRDDAEGDAGNVDKKSPASAEPPITPTDAPPDAGLSTTLTAKQFEITVAGDQSLWNLVTRQSHQLGMIVEPPPDAAHWADETNRATQFIYNESDPRSEFVFNYLSRVLDREAQRVIQARVTRAAGSDHLLQPFTAAAVSTASPQQRFAKILAMVVPFLLVIMSVTGAMYPAIDLTAGERERGTLETLAASPVPVGQIVAGKFGVIVTIAMVSTALNLASMSAVIHFAGLEQLLDLKSRRAAPATTSPVVSGGTNEVPDTAVTTQHASAAPRQADYFALRARLEAEAKQQSSFLVLAAPLVMLAMVPFAVLFSAVMLATCSFARTFKEAQNYMMPVMMAAIIPAMVVSYMPTLKLEGALLVVPVANVVVLIRDLFLGQANGSAATICLLSTSFYAAAAVAAAAKLYGHEAVLFSDVAGYKTLLRRRFIVPRPRPGPAMALLTVALAFPVYFYWQSASITVDSTADRLRNAVALGQLLILAAPPLLLAAYAKLDLRETFSLRAPALLPTLGTLLIATSIVPVGQLLQQIQGWAVPGLRPSGEMFRKQAELMLDGSLTAILIAFALVPAVCEEILFRGFLLGGLKDRARPVAVAIVVGLAFGLFHIYAEKIPLTAVLGVVLSLVCLYSGSIFPAMLIHTANNGLALLAARPEGARLADWLGLVEAPPAGEIVFNARAATFLAAFLVGLLLVVVGRRGEDRMANSE